MHIYLVRHGDAVSAHPSGDRPLSDQGRQEAQRMAGFLSRAGVRVGTIVHSGKARAAQTAEILNDGLNGSAGLDVWPGLHPNDPVAPVAARLRRTGSDLMVVGHLPFMAKLAGHLVYGEDNAILELHATAVVCLVKGDAGVWLIEWLVYPALLGID
jgi:phosphohistidine phosphatase